MNEHANGVPTPDELWTLSYDAALAIGLSPMNAPKQKYVWLRTPNRRPPEVWAPTDFPRDWQRLERYAQLNFSPDQQRAYVDFIDDYAARRVELDSLNPDDAAFIAMTAPLWVKTAAMLHAFRLEERIVP